MANARVKADDFDFAQFALAKTVLDISGKRYTWQLPPAGVEKLAIVKAAYDERVTAAQGAYSEALANAKKVLDEATAVAAAESGLSGALAAAEVEGLAPVSAKPAARKVSRVSRGKAPGIDARAKQWGRENSIPGADRIGRASVDLIDAFRAAGGK